VAPYGTDSRSASAPSRTVRAGCRSAGCAATRTGQGGLHSEVADGTLPGAFPDPGEDGLGCTCGGSAAPQQRRLSAPGCGPPSGPSGTAADAVSRQRARRRDAARAWEAGLPARRGSFAPRRRGGPLVRQGGPATSHQAQQCLILSVARVQGGRVGGHHPASGRPGAFSTATQGVGMWRGGLRRADAGGGTGRRRSSRTP
jgi:hypothetical protein